MRVSFDVLDEVHAYSDGLDLFVSKKARFRSCEGDLAYALLDGRRRDR